MNYQRKHAVLALITAFAALTADTSRAENFRFDENGHFPFIQISDFQVGSTDYQASLDTLTNCLASCAERGAPKLVILTGDQVQGVNDIDSFRTIITPLIECLINCRMKIAYAFGNHDSEGATDPAAYRQQQYDAVKQIAGEWFVDFDVSELTGTGSGVIPVLASDGGDTVGYNLFIMDSGSYVNGPDSGYDGCHADQIQWYVDNSGGDTPCLWFQHIIVPEGAASIFASPTRAIGSRPETPCPTADSAYNDNGHTLPPLVDGGSRRTLYDVWRETGNLRAAYFGHDHKNYSDGTDDNGIRIGYTKSLTVQSYGDGDPGFRYFCLNEDGTYRTEIHTRACPGGMGFWDYTNTVAGAREAGNFNTYTNHCTGRWDFDAPDNLLKATLGADGHVGTVQNKSSVQADGIGSITSVTDTSLLRALVADGSDGAITVPQGNHLRLAHGLSAANYSLRWRFASPSSSHDSWRALLWNGRNDGTLFIGNSGKNNKIGGNGSYWGDPIETERWYTLEVVVCGNIRYVYLDGEPLNMNSYTGNEHGLDILNDPLIYVFGDDDGEDNALHIASFEVFDTCLYPLPAFMPASAFSGEPDPTDDIPALYRAHCLGKWDFDKADDILASTEFGKPLVTGKTSGGVSVPQSGTGDIAAVAEPPANTLDDVDLGGVAVVPFHSHLIPTDTLTPEVAAGDFTFRMFIYMPSDLNEQGYWCMFWSGENRDGVGFTKTDSTFGGGTLQDDGDPKYVYVHDILDNWHEFRFIYTQEGERLTCLMDGNEIRSAGDINTGNFACIFGDNDTDDNPLYIGAIELFDTADQTLIPPYLSDLPPTYTVLSPVAVTDAEGSTIALNTLITIPEAGTISLTAPATVTSSDTDVATTVMNFNHWSVKNAQTGSTLSNCTARTIVFDAGQSAVSMIFEAVFDTIVKPKKTLYRAHCIGKWDFDKADDILAPTLYGKPLVAGNQVDNISVRVSGTGAISALANADIPENTLEGVALGGVAVVPQNAHLIPTDTFTPAVAAGDFTYRMFVYLPSEENKKDFWCMFWAGEDKDGIGFVRINGTFGGGNYRDDGDESYVPVDGILDNWHEFRFIYTQAGKRLTTLMDGQQIRTGGNMSIGNFACIFGDNDGEDNPLYIGAIELFDTADQSQIPIYQNARDLIKPFCICIF